MPKRAYSPERHFHSIINKEQRNPVDIKLKQFVERAVSEGASKELVHKLLESAIRIKKNRFRAQRAKEPKRKTLSFQEVKAKIGTYDFYEVPMWGYVDKYLGVHTNAITPGLVGYRHLVLRDKTKAANYV